MDATSQLRRPFAVTLEPWLRAASATQGVLRKNETVTLAYDVAAPGEGAQGAQAVVVYLWCIC